MSFIKLDIRIREIVFGKGALFRFLDAVDYVYSEYS